jgi:uncharacterized protein YkwD
LRLINAYRESKRLSPFVSEPIVYQQALEHSLAMVKNDDLSHDGFDKRVKEINKTIFSMASAENVAFNQGEDNPANTGLAVAKSNDGKYYFTQIFIRVGKNR